jgi:hypothetical protein
MRFVIEVDCRNAAFAGDDNEVTQQSAMKEIGPLLSEVAECLAYGRNPKVIVDLNGNTCGTVRFLKDRKSSASAK